MMPKHQKENILVVIRVAVLTLKNIPCSQGHTPPPPLPRVNSRNRKEITGNLPGEISALDREY